MSFNIRLKEIQVWSGLNPTQFGDSLKNTHRENVRVLLKKTDSYPGLQILQDILEAYPQIDALWLITGKGEMLGGNSIVPDVVEEALVAYLREQLKECQEQLHAKLEECGALKCELDIVKKENGILRTGGSDRGQQIPEARAG